MDTKQIRSPDKRLIRRVLSRVLVAFKLKPDPLVMEARRLEAESKYLEAAQTYERAGKKFRFDAFRCYEKAEVPDIKNIFSRLLGADCSRFALGLADTSAYTGICNPSEDKKKVFFPLRSRNHRVCI